MAESGISSSERTVGREAQRNNILAAKAVADIVKTTLGPKGMDKMLVDASGNITVTNDGVTILDEMDIEHPAAKMLVEIARTQEKEVGDGTTTAAMLAGSLLEKAEGLLDKKIHPTVIVDGYRLAEEMALSALDEMASPLTNATTLMKIAETAMTGKGAEGNKEKLSALIVGAVHQIAEGKNANLQDVKIVKVQGGGVAESELVHGMVLNKERANKEMPSVVENAKILLVDFALEIRAPESQTTLSLSSPEQLEAFLQAEENYLRGLVDKIIASGANVVLCQKGIDDVAQYFLAKARVLGCRRVPKEDMERLARATGARVVSNLHEVGAGELGSAAHVEEIVSGDEPLLMIRGCHNPKAVTILLRGGTHHVVDEIERAVRDGLGDVVSAVRSGKVVCGGGATEIELARRLRHFARTVGGRAALAIEAFSDALETVPETLAENAGLDPIDVVTALKKRHEEGHAREGLNLFTNKIEDTFAAGIIEPVRVKTQAISSATEVAMMILRIDDVLIAKGKRGESEKVSEKID